MTPTEQTAEVRYPFVVTHGQSPIEIAFEVPAKQHVSDGFVYIPAGEFRFGYGQNPAQEPIRLWYEALPLHSRFTDAYMIARHETTYLEWIEFLSALPPDERASRMPNVDVGYRAATIQLIEDQGGYKLRMMTGPRS